MKGLAVADGDLVLSSGDYYCLTGTPKINQDLTFALTDVYGADPYHPYWGSVLDQFIGRPLSEETQTLVRAEVVRVLNNYIAVQADQINSEASQGIRGTLTTSDVVNQVSSIDITVNFDSITIAITLLTMSDNEVRITRQVTS